MRRIESPSNPLVKTLFRLAHPRKREAQFLLEGKKLVDVALQSGTEVETIVVSSAYGGAPPENAPAVELEDALFRKVSTLESPEGILAIARRPSPTASAVGAHRGCRRDSGSGQPRRHRPAWSRRAAPPGS